MALSFRRKESPRVGILLLLASLSLFLLSSCALYQRTLEGGKLLGSTFLAKVRGWERLARAEEEALRNDPDDVWARVRLGAIYIREGKYYKAEKQLSRAAAEMPTPVVLGPEGRINYAQEPPQGALPPWARVAGPQGQDLLPRYILILHHLGEGRGGEALSLSEDLLKGSPGDPLAVVLRARALELRGDGAAAEEALQGALEEAGQHPLILYRLGLLYREAEKHGQASSLFRKALSLAPDFRDARRGLALSLLAAGNPEEALPPLREALKEEPGDGALHNALGEALKALGRDEEAVSAFREGVRLSGGVVEYRLNLANLLQELGRKEEASEAFAEAGRLGRGNARALLAAARLKGTLGDIKAARSLIAEGLRISPEDKVPFYLLEAELLLEQGRGEAALDMLRRAQREAPTDAEVVLRLAGLYEDIHRPYLASAGYRRYLRLKPEGSAGDSLEQRAQGLEKEFEAEIERLMHSAQEAEALRRIKEDLAEIPDDPLLNLLLGRALLALGFIEEGRRALGLAEASFGDDPRYRLALAEYFLKKEKLASAREELLKAQRVAPRNPELSLGLGNLHLRMREFPQAISRYREALALMPGYGRGHLALARAYVLAGRREEALLTLVEGLPHLGASALAELEMDKDFAPLRRDLRFWKLVGKAPGGSAPIKRTKVKKSKRRPATPSGGPSFQPYFARVFVRGSPDPIPGRVRVVGERDGRVTVELVDLLRTRLSFPRGDVVIERFALPKGGVQ